MTEPKAPCLCIPTARVREILGNLQGFVGTPGVDTYSRLLSLIGPGACRFLPREPDGNGYSCETDETYKQIIPYLVLVADGGLLTYTRAPGGGETRLHGKRAAGPGGHIESRDVAYTCHHGKAIPSWSITIRNAAERELAEETNGALVSQPYSSYMIPTHTSSLIGFVNDDSDPVGRVHLGIVYKVDITHPNRLTFAPEIADARWEDPKAIDMEQFEGWSRIVVDAMRDGRIE